MLIIRRIFKYETVSNFEISRWNIAKFVALLIAFVVFHINTKKRQNEIMQKVEHQ